MLTTGVVSLLVSVVAAGISGATVYLTVRWRTHDRRVALVNSYFHRNDSFAQLRNPDGSVRKVGYQLVVWNRGPAVAEAVDILVETIDGTPVTVCSLLPGELPVPRLEAEARYPIPWVLADENQRDIRLFRVQLKWTDGAGAQMRTLQLRRGQV
jgi:hypothetical protein